ncbi:MAG: hypothetical protein HYV03_01340 [Deltaproteobacteria bacterium]|nr:hypothetical protein [Deltaproteobacteria bacterium]
MAVTHIIDGALRIDLIDPAEAEALEYLDTNGDQIISPEDFLDDSRLASVSGARLQQVFSENVAAALSGEWALNPFQHKGLVRFFSLYTQVKSFDAVTTEWAWQKTNYGCCELEFAPDYWGNSVLPMIDAWGEFAPESLTAMAYDMYSTVYYLAGMDIPAKDVQLPSGWMGCGETYISALALPMADVPASLRAPLWEMMGAYGRSALWLLQYKQIECEGVGCDSPAEVSFKTTPFWPPPAGIYPAMPGNEKDLRHQIKTMVFAGRTAAEFPELVMFDFTTLCGGYAGH